MNDINKLRLLAQDATPGPWYVGSGIHEGRNIYSVVSVTDAEGFTYQPVVATAEDNDTKLWSENTSFIAAANPAAVSELLDRLEAAERERDWHADRCKDTMSECASLRAKIVEMEKQEPVAWADAFGEPFRQKSEIDGVASPLYALPSVQNVPDFADAYQGAMEEVAIWKKRALEAEDLNRNFLVEINGPMLMGEPVAQPSPSTEIVPSYLPPSGWLRVIDEALVVAHIGVANADDTYEEAGAKLDSLIGFHVVVATDPAVNGGWKLVPNVPEGFSREDLEAVADGLDGYEKNGQCRQRHRRG